MAEVVEKKSNGPWVVTDRDGRRVFFEGTEADAQSYVEANFPRLHVEPGNNYGEGGPDPDAYVRSPAGVHSWFNGEEWLSEK